MKRISWFLFLALGALSVHAQTVTNSPEGLDAETVSNLVETVRMKANDCDPKHDEQTVAPVTAKVNRLLNDLDLSGAALDEGGRKTVHAALVSLIRVLKDVEEKIEMAGESNAIRLKNLPAPDEYPAEMYGMKGTEVRAMLVQQFSRNDDTLNAYVKRIEVLLKRSRDWERKLAQK